MERLEGRERGDGDEAEDEDEDEDSTQGPRTETRTRPRTRRRPKMQSETHIERTQSTRIRTSPSGRQSLGGSVCVLIQLVHYITGGLDAGSHFISQREKTSASRAD
jgi:hypothetical protein